MAKVPTIGQFNRRIQALRYNNVNDGFGRYIEQVENIYSTWAYIQPTRSNRAYLENQNNQLNYYDCYIRFSEERPINKSIRISYENRLMTIESFTEIREGAKRFWKLILSEQIQ